MVTEGETKVVSIKRGAPVADDPERRFVEELAMKVRAFAEDNGCLPDLAVLCLYGPSEGEDEMAWAAGFYSPGPVGRTVAYGTAMAIIAKALGQ